METYHSKRLLSIMNEESTLQILTDEYMPQKGLILKNGHEEFYKHAIRKMKSIELSYKSIRENKDQKKQGRLFYELQKIDQTIFCNAEIARHMDISAEQVRRNKAKYIDAPAKNKNAWKPKRLPSFWDM